MHTPIKFASKKTLGRDYVVPPAEALWWSDDPDNFAGGHRVAWKWTILSMVPKWVDEAMVNAASQRALSKGISRGEDVSLRSIEEGDCFQSLHIGSFADEAPKLHQLHSELMPRAGVTFAGPHHEIYLTDPRRSPPEKMRTILRQPVTPTSP